MNRKILGTILLIIGVLLSLISGIMLFKMISFSKEANDMFKGFGLTEESSMIKIENSTGLYLMLGIGIILIGFGIFFIVKK